MDPIDPRSDGPEGSRQRCWRERATRTAGITAILELGEEVQPVQGVGVFRRENGGWRQAEQWGHDRRRSPGVVEASLSRDLVLPSLGGVRALRRLRPRHADNRARSMGGAVRTDRTEQQAAGEPPPASPDNEQVWFAYGSYERRSNGRSGEGYPDRHVCGDAPEDLDQRILHDAQAAAPVCGALVARAGRRRTVDRREAHVPSDMDHMDRDVPMAGLLDREPERAQAGGRPVDAARKLCG